jgi:hypothetical protein
MRAITQQRVASESNTWAQVQTDAPAPSRDPFAAARRALQNRRRCARPRLLDNEKEQSEIYHIAIYRVNSCRIAAAPADLS